MYFNCVCVKKRFFFYLGRFDAFFERNSLNLSLNKKSVEIQFGKPVLSEALEETFRPNNPLPYFSSHLQLPVSYLEVITSEKDVKKLSQEVRA